MRRIGYAGLITVMTFAPLAIVWASDRGPAAAGSPSAGYQRHYGGSRFNAYYFGGGHGGWFSNSYGWGRGDLGYDRDGGAGRYRSGGPGAGGK
ncbi:MAG: hypothetical protein VKP62_15145 [Candidatus Sericytochromatia bacterium]|nr:hypothetical protein [Candidatus Sericytochromatia bacterium]